MQAKGSAIPSVDFLKNGVKSLEKGVRGSYNK